MKNLLFIVAIFGILATSCKSNSKISDKNTDIDFIVAKNYYVKNSVETIDNPKIETLDDFKKIFGMATLQGDEGKPTEIDFDNQFVIAVVMPPSNTEIILTPVSLSNNNENKLEFTYSIQKGVEQTHTIKPCLIIIVDKKYNADVVLVEKVIENEEVTENFVSDIEGNKYKIVKIGEQWWFAENLKTTKYNDGSPITNITDNNQWFSATSEGFCWNENNETTKDTYGAYYNWYAVNSEKLCPDGWHVPSPEEWETLITYLGGEEIAGGKMKLTGTDNWQTSNKDATNESGFSALPAGYRNLTDGTFQDMGWGANFWSSDNSNAPKSIFLDYNSGKTVFQDQSKGHGFSVRCIKDK